MRVSMPLSSRKTSRRGSTVASSARQVARASATSGRSCSRARSVFFARQAELLERPAHGRSAHPHPGTPLEPGRVLGQGRIVAPGHHALELVQRRRVQPRRRAAGVRAAGVRPGLAPPLGPPRPQPTVDRGLADPEQGGDLGPAQPATLAGQQHPLAQVRRIGSRHDQLSPRAHHARTDLPERGLPTRMQRALSKRCLSARELTVAATRGMGLPILSVGPPSCG